MRWLFADPDDQHEATQREAVLRRVDRWWEAFASRRQELEAFFQSSSAEWDLAEWMQDHLQAIDANLMWEFGPGLQQPGRRLVITPETQRQLRPLVNVILSRAPSLSGWEFYGYRPAEQLNDVVETVRGLCGGDVSKAMVHARHDGHHRIAISYYTPECKQPEADRKQVELAAFVATEASVGEALLDRWIGTIDVQPLSQDKPRGECSRAIPFGRLQPTVEAIVGSLLDQLPDEPCYRQIAQSSWSSYELAPEPASEFGGRTDLCVAISARPDVFEALHGGSPFYSDTHSRCQETFCYLKIDGDGEPMAVRAQVREQIEATIDQVLTPAQLGCVIGGGTGLRYSYVDLALTDVQRAVQVLRRLGERGLFAPRSWLLFCDAELADEWLPLTEGAPPPPSCSAATG
jgi:hypothetical protein